MDRRPIGIFDSGVGGLTIVDKVFRLLENESVIYLGDTARVPYGNKSRETVTRFSKEIVDFLLRFKVKLIIVACNTVSSLSLAALKKICPVPLIGVIRPGVEEAIEKSKTKRIGVIGTDATISSKVYRNEIKRIRRDAFVTERSCPLFVPLVENMWFDGDITLRIARSYLKPVVNKRVDSLILGCTHYPLLKATIRKVAGNGVALIDSSAAVARHTKHILEKKRLSNTCRRKNARFFVTDDTKGFAHLAKVFLGKNIKAERVLL